LFARHIAFLFLLCFFRPHSANAQVFEMTGGSSSQLDAEGGSLEVKGNDYTARIDLGYLHHPSLGFFYSRPFKSSILGAGDQQIPFVLPTDLFDHSYYFLGRGLSLLRKSKDRRLFVFAGTTSDGYSTPFLSIARNDTPSGAIFYEQQITPTTRFFSRNIFSKRQTSIQSLEWAARKDIKMALSAGIGNNQGYGSSSFALDKRWISVDASYALAGPEFQRVLVATPQLSENDRENIRVEFHPWANVRFVVTRNNYLASFPPNVSERAMVQGVGVGTSLAGFQSYGSWFQSSTSAGNSTALAVGVRRMLTPHFEAGVDYLHSSFSKGVADHSIIGNLREILNARLSVTETITENSGQTSVDFGGNFISNFVTVSVDYQTVFLPFVQSSSGQFKQVMVLGLHFQLPHGVQFNVDSNVTPLGQVQYTAYGSTYAYRGMGNSAPGTSFTGSFFQNIVRGKVVNSQGEPIEGAALRIGSELAITDTDGNFMVRVKKEGELELKIEFSEFTAPGNYVVERAPSTVKAMREESAQEYTVVLRRTLNAPRPDDPSHPLSQPNLQEHTPGSN